VGPWPSPTLSHHRPGLALGAQRGNPVVWMNAACLPRPRQPGRTHLHWRAGSIWQLPAHTSRNGLEGLQAAGSLTLNHNAPLTDVSALSRWAGQIGRLDVRDNPSLCVNDVFAALSNASLSSTSVWHNGRCP
jgi:hypothetical protein